MEPLISEEDKREIKSMGAELEMIPLEQLQELKPGQFCWIINFRKNPNPTPEHLDRAKDILDRFMRRFVEEFGPKIDGATEAAARAEADRIMKEIKSYRYSGPAKTSNSVRGR